MLLGKFQLTLVAELRDAIGIIIPSLIERLKHQDPSARYTAAAALDKFAEHGAS